MIGVAVEIPVAAKSDEFQPGPGDAQIRGMKTVNRADE